MENKGEPEAAVEQQMRVAKGCTLALGALFAAFFLPTLLGDSPAKMAMNDQDAASGFAPAYAGSLVLGLLTALALVKKGPAPGKGSLVLAGLALLGDALSALLLSLVSGWKSVGMLVWGLLILGLGAWVGQGARREEGWERWGRLLLTHGIFGIVIALFLAICATEEGLRALGSGAYLYVISLLSLIGLALWGRRRPSSEAPAS